MPADRLLITLLRNLQTHTLQQDTPRLLGTAASLFSTLSNPRNLTLLTAQLLCANALWTPPTSLQDCLRFMSTFQSPALAILRHEDEVAQNPEVAASTPPGQPVVGGNLSREEWVKAVVAGADERSHRWRHLLVLGGLLIGFESQDRQGLSRSLRATLGTALVNATNVALQETTPGDELGRHSIALVLNYSFEILSHTERSAINYDLLLPVLIGAAFFSNEGYRSAYYLGSLDADIVQVSSNKFTWSDRSASFRQLSELSNQPLVATMGPLTRLIGHTCEHLRDSSLLQTLVDDLEEFAKTLITQWRYIKISEVDPHEEPLYFDEHAMSKTLPILWKLLRSSLFAVVIVLRGVLARLLSDRFLASPEVAPSIATKVLLTLRSLYFITSRLGQSSFSQSTFVNLTAIDILTAYPDRAAAFIDSIKPMSMGQIPSHPLDRTLDLFFLNTAEHFTLLLTPAQTANILIPALTPYLNLNLTSNRSSPPSPSLIEIFEAAHSVMLSILSAPQSATNSDLAASHLPFYIDALFSVFPHNLSARQFRLAFRTLVRITSPPAPLSATHPELAEIVLDLLHHRASAPPKEPRRPAPYTVPMPQDNPSGSDRPDGTNASSSPDPEVSIAEERLTIVLTIIDCLPFLQPSLLEYWLPLAAELINVLSTDNAKRQCRERFWDVLSDGDMDVDRSRVCVGWWGTRGGREMVLGLPLPLHLQADTSGEDQSQGYYMSGALGNVEASDSKL